jgi:hypothetical protein
MHKNFLKNLHICKKSSTFVRQLELLSSFINNYTNFFDYVKSNRCRRR